MAAQMSVGQPMQQQHKTVINPAPVATQPMQQPNAFNAQTANHQSKLRGLAIAELVLGCICVILGIASCSVVAQEINLYARLLNSYNTGYGYRYSYRYSLLFTTGEGIWCGIWIIIAGALGIRAAIPGASRCMINAHLALSVVASIFCGILVIISSVSAAYAAYIVSISVTNSILCVGSFASMVLLIVSASYCCATLNCCCCEPTHTQAQHVSYATPVMYNQQPGVVVFPHQPAPFQYQGAPNMQQGYVLQGTQPLVQTTFPPTVVEPPTAQPFQAMNPAPPAAGYPAPNQTAPVSATPQLAAPKQQAMNPAPPAAGYPAPNQTAPVSAAPKQQEGITETKTDFPPSYNHAFSQ